MAAIALLDARDTTTWIGCLRTLSWAPRPSSFTPSLIWWIQRESASSRMVIGRVASMRP